MQLAQEVAQWGCRVPDRADFYTKPALRAFGAEIRELLSGIRKRDNADEIRAVLAPRTGDESEIFGRHYNSRDLELHIRALKKLVKETKKRPDDARLGRAALGSFEEYKAFTPYDARHLAELANYKVSNIANYCALGRQHELIPSMNTIMLPEPEFFVEYALDQNLAECDTDMFRIAGCRVREMTREEVFSEHLGSTIVSTRAKTFVGIETIVYNDTARYSHLATTYLALNGNHEVLASETVALGNFKATQEEVDICAKKIAPTVNAMLFAIALMSFTNVQIKQVDSDTTSRLPATVARDDRRSAGTERSNEPADRYYILKIRTLDEVVRRAKTLDPQKLSQPLHQVRGHVRDYRNGPGLFGNTAQRRIVFVPAYVRGNEKFGVITKDYESATPKTDSPNLAKPQLPKHAIDTSSVSQQRTTRSAARESNGPDFTLF